MKRSTLLKSLLLIVLLLGLYQFLHASWLLEAPQAQTIRAVESESPIGWDSVPAILARIQPPVFPARIKGLNFSLLAGAVMTQLLLLCKLFSVINHKEHKTHPCMDEFTYFHSYVINTSVTTIWF